MSLLETNLLVSQNFKIDYGAELEVEISCSWVLQVGCDDEHPSVSRHKDVHRSCESIGSLRKEILGRESISLNLSETLIALSISATTSPTARLAMEQLDKLRGTEVHLTHLPSPGDEKALRRLGVNLTSDPRFATDQLRGDYRDVICERMAIWCAARTTDEAVAQLNSAGLPAASQRA